MYQSLLPPGFLIFIEVTAIIGYFVFAALIISYGWRAFKFFLREQAANKRWIFALLCTPLLILFIIIFKFFFLRSTP